MKSVVIFAISLALFLEVAYCTKQRRLQKQTRNSKKHVVTDRSTTSTTTVKHLGIFKVFYVLKV